MAATDDSDTEMPSRGRILIVEDDEATVRYLVRALERHGFEAEGVGDAVEAERHLAAVDYDALLVDIVLPGPSGFDLVREMKAAHPHLPMAMMTAHASMDVAVRALRSEVDDFLAKPIEPQALVEQVERLVRRGAVAQAGVERVLAIGAHPDDVEFGVGGTLLWHKFMGDEVAITTMCRGSRGGDREARATEAKRAAARIGARLFLHDLDDTQISESEPTVSLIEGVIEEFTPTIVYTHSWNDLHQDHRNTHRASLVAARRVPSLYCYESPSATVDFRPARFVAIDPFLDAKIETIEFYTSQVELRSYLDPDLVRSASRYWGRFGDSRYCEPLEVIRERSRDRSPVTVEDVRARA
jgi:two-component system, NtrC family, response regulator HydG